MAVFTSIHSSTVKFTSFVFNLWYTADWYNKFLYDERISISNNFNNSYKNKTQGRPHLLALSASRHFLADPLLHLPLAPRFRPLLESSRNFFFRATRPLLLQLIVKCSLIGSYYYYLTIQVSTILYQKQ